MKNFYDFKVDNIKGLSAKEKEFRNKAVAIWFQMAELVWKSMYYEDDPSFLEHEKLGDELPWKHKSKLTDK